MNSAKSTEVGSNKPTNDNVKNRDPSGGSSIPSGCGTGTQQSLLAHRPSQPMGALGSSAPLTRERLVLIDLRNEKAVPPNPDTEVVGKYIEDQSGNWMVIPREQEKLASRLFRDPTFGPAIENREPSQTVMDQHQLYGRPGHAEDVKQVLLKHHQSSDSIKADAGTASRVASATSSVVSLASTCQCYCVSSKEVTGAGAQFE